MSVTELRYNDRTTVAEFNVRFENDSHDLLILREGIHVTEEQFRDMRQVLYAAEMHSMASPRINDGSPLSLPYDLPAGSVLPPQKALSLAQAARKYLPVFSRVPAPSLHCMLIKRTVIHQMGGLDIDFRSVGAALLAYGCQINRYGFNAVAANHVFVESGGNDFASSENAWEIEDMDRVTSLYPAYAPRLQQYLDADIHACDRFLELLDPGYHEKPKILVDYSNMSACHDDTAQVQNAFLRKLRLQYDDIYDVYVLASPEADRFHRLSASYPHVYGPEALPGKFHLACTLTPAFSPEEYDILNNRCLKVVFIRLDTIASRCNHLWLMHTKSMDMLRLGAKLCDAIIAVSDASAKDYPNHFAGGHALTDCPVKTIYLDAALQKTDDDPADALDNDNEFKPAESQVHSSILQIRENMTTQMEMMIRDILRWPVDPQRLQKRYHFINLAVHHWEWASVLTKRSLSQKVRYRIAIYHPVLMKFLKKCRRVIREIREGQYDLWSL